MSDEIGGPDIGGSNTDSNHVHTEEGTGNDTTVVSISSSSTRQTSSEPNDSSFASVRIPTEEWKRRLQDGGCAKSALKKKTYQKNKIPGYGPVECPIFYYDLTSIAIDWMKSFKNEHLLGRGWNKIPKNPTDVKMKIIERLLAMRKYNPNTGSYELEQSVLLGQLENVWGYAQPSTQLHHNDRLRLFGLLMTLPHNLAAYTRLGEGIKNRAVFDDPNMNPKAIFAALAVDFNNNDIIVQLPVNAMDVDGFESLGANDITRIRIHRDRELLLIFTYIKSLILLIIIHLFFN